MMPSFLPAIIKFALSPAGLITGAFILGGLMGEVHGRKVVTAKWQERVIEAELKAKDIQDASNAVINARADEVAAGRASMREDDQSLIKQNMALQQALRADRAQFQRQLAEARNDPSKFNCANVPMPRSLQFHPSDSDYINNPN